jgi:hypothetical protein
MRRQQDIDDQKSALQSILQELKEGFPSTGEVEKLRAEIIEQQKTILQLQAEKLESSPTDEEHEGFLLQATTAWTSEEEGDASGKVLDIKLPSHPSPGDTTHPPTAPIEQVMEMLNDIALLERATQEGNECKAERQREERLEGEKNAIQDRLQNFAFRNHHGRFATGTPGGELTWNATTVQGWERFYCHVVSHNEGETRVGFKSAHGKFLCADSNGAWTANRDAIGEWEVFTLITHTDGRISLRSCHGFYMRCVAPNIRMIFGIKQPEENVHADNASHCQDWEKYHVYH